MLKALAPTGQFAAGGAVTIEQPRWYSVFQTNVGDDPVVIDAGANSADITIDASIDGADVNLNLTAGVTGDIFFNGAVGQIAPIGTVTINEADDVNVAAAFTSATFNQVVAGVGTFNLDALLTADTGTVTINSNEVDLDGSIRTSGDAQPSPSLVALVASIYC